MPNWSYNVYAVKAKTKNVLDFVNEGLKNLGLEPRADIKDAIENLWKNNKVMLSTFRPIPETYLKFGSKRYRNDLLSGNSNFKSDEEYENYLKEYNAAKKYQQETYGVVGINDYNCTVGFGCKWDTEVELGSYSIDDINDITTIYLKGRTPGVYPGFWLQFLYETFKLNVFIYTCEEMQRYHFFAQINDHVRVLEGYRFNEEEKYMPDKSDYDYEEDYAFAVFESLSKACNIEHFYEAVNNYAIKIQL